MGAINLVFSVNPIFLHFLNFLFSFSLILWNSLKNIFYKYNAWNGFFTFTPLPSDMDYFYFKLLLIRNIQVKLSSTHSPFLLRRAPLATIVLYFLTRISDRSAGISSSSRSFSDKLIHIGSKIRTSTLGAITSATTHSAILPYQKSICVAKEEESIPQIFCGKSEISRSEKNFSNKNMLIHLIQWMY